MKKVTPQSFEIDIKTVEGERLTSFGIGINGKSYLLTVSIFDDGDVHLMVHPKGYEADVTVFGADDNIMKMKNWDNGCGKYRSWSLEKEIV